MIQSKKHITLVCVMLVIIMMISVISGCAKVEDLTAEDLQSLQQQDIEPAQPESTVSEEPPVEQPKVIVTVNGGDTIDDIAENLSKGGYCNADDFRQCCEQIPDIELFSSYEPIDIRRYPVEGYIFAGEYDISGCEDAQSILDLMLSKAQEAVTDEMLERAEYYDMSFDEIITLASIVQLESKFEDAMPGVSAVFHSRLESPDYPNLQSDMTKKYADGAYNTYEVKGLPAGAVCNPTLNAVNAALYPQEGLTAYYFVYDTNGQYYYAKDYKEHKANIKMLQEQGIFDLW